MTEQVAPPGHILGAVPLFILRATLLAFTLGDAFCSAHVFFTDEQAQGVVTEHRGGQAWVRYVLPDGASGVLRTSDGGKFRPATSLMVSLLVLGSALALAFPGRRAATNEDARPWTSKRQSG